MLFTKKKVKAIRLRIKNLTKWTEKSELCQKIENNLFKLLLTYIQTCFYRLEISVSPDSNQTLHLNGNTNH